MHWEKAACDYEVHGGGRFLQTDPVGYEDQMNLYAYVGNDPMNHTDPTGEESLANFEADLRVDRFASGEVTADEYLDEIITVGENGIAVADAMSDVIAPGKGLAKVAIKKSIKSVIKKRRNIEIKHSSRKLAKEAAKHAHSGKPRPTPKKTASASKRKRYSDQQKYRSPERHKNSEHDGSHFHDSNKRENEDVNRHHTFPDR